MRLVGVALWWFLCRTLRLDDVEVDFDKLEVHVHEMARDLGL